MHVLDFSYDELLEILKHVRVADIRAWIQTCRAFASLQDPHLVLPLQLLRLATEHDLSLDCLELPAGAAAAIKSLVTRPQRFQDLLINGSLSGQSLRRYQTNIDHEKVLEAKIVPGGRWLVTISSHGFGWMMCRVWDLDIAPEKIVMVPAASTPLPPTKHRNAGQLWLQRGTKGHITQILVYVEGLIVIEFDHLDQERPLRLLGMVNIGHMDTSDSQGIGLHGDYVFDTTDRKMTVVNWVTGREEAFRVERPAFIESNSHILSIGSEGLILLDQLEQSIAFYAVPRTGHEAQDQTEGSQQKSVPIKILSHIKQISIEGIVSYEEEPTHWPPVNRPYSARQQANAVIRFPQHLVYAEYPSNPRAADLDTLPLAFHLPPGSSEPAAYRRTIDGHVVGVSVREFDVHFLMKDGTQSVQPFEHDFGNNFTRKFVCPLGGVIGGFGLFQGADEIYLWSRPQDISNVLLLLPMHLLDLPEDALLEIIQRLRLVDVPTLVQTCKAFASLRETHLKHAFDLLRLVHKYALGSETLDIPPIGAEVRRKLALPYKFEEAMISGSLSENSLQRYETTVTNEDVYNASLFPGGRWLVTVSGNRQPDAIESSLPSHIPAMKYRIWDLQKSRTDLLMSPVAYVAMPPDESEISGEIWLRDDEDGEGCQIWAYSDHKLRELVFDPRDCCLYERRSINVLGLDTSYDIGFHGDYIFNYEDEFHILDRGNGVRASFQLSPEPMDGFLRWYRFLTIVDDGLVLLDSDKQNLLYYRPNIRQWGLRGMLGDDQFKAPRLELLRAIPIRGIESRIKDDFSYNPVVNRPFSPGKSTTALARFASTLAHFEIPDDPALEDLERSLRIFPFRSWPETTPRVHAKTISGHVVAIAKPFNVHLLRTGEEVITHRVDYDLENADSNNAFACPIGGILGATHRMEEIWLWKAGDHA